jgi:hypothetical protein
MHAGTRPKQDRSRRSCNTIHAECWLQIATVSVYVYVVAAGDTDDLIFTRNIDEVVNSHDDHDAREGRW